MIFLHVCTRIQLGQHPLVYLDYGHQHGHNTRTQLAAGVTSRKRDRSIVQVNNARHQKHLYMAEQGTYRGWSDEHIGASIPLHRDSLGW
jgi:hypothetical protein